MVELMRLILVMLLLFLSFEARLNQTEATDTNCEVQSAYFIGFCLIDHHCEMVCKIEGFPTGKCSGLAPHCSCLSTCQQPSPPSPPPVNPPECQPPSPPEYSLPPPSPPEYSLPPPSPGYSSISAADLQ